MANLAENNDKYEYDDGRSMEDMNTEEKCISTDKDSGSIWKWNNIFFRNPSTHPTLSCGRQPGKSQTFPQTGLGTIIFFLTFPLGFPFNP